MHFWSWLFRSSQSYSLIPNHQKFNLCIALRIVPTVPSGIQTYESLNNVIFERIQALALNWQHSLISHSMRTHCCQIKTKKPLWYFALSGLHQVCSITHSHTQASLSAFGKLDLQTVLVGTTGEERWRFPNPLWQTCPAKEADSTNYYLKYGSWENEQKLGPIFGKHSFFTPKTDISVGTQTSNTNSESKPLRELRFAHKSAEGPF